MTAQEIRRKYLEFFEKRGHTIIPRAQLVPQDDPTTLFTGSGMQPLIPYLLGDPHPAGVRLVDSQTCLRSQDIEEVGNNRHTTFFEMLGNWSLGDYFKQEEITWLFEFLVDEIGLDPSKLYVTCYLGNTEFNIPKDTEAAGIWAGLFKSKNIDPNQLDIGSEADGYAKGMGEGRIFFYDGSKNWWSRAGGESQTPLGDPGGPDTEVFYDFGTPHNSEFGEHCHPNCDCGRFIEIANSVFMAYKRTEDGFEPLQKPNVDFGGGLERIAAAAIDSPDVFKISLLWPIIEKLQELSGKKYESHNNDMRIIADHLRGAVFLAVDGVVPSNKEQGYVARRLMRRAILKAFNLGIEQDFIEQIVPVIAGLYEQDYPELVENRQKIIESLVREEKIFRQTLRNGVRDLNKIARSNTNDGGEILITGRVIFTMYDTNGFPAELTLEEVARHEDWTVSSNWQKEYDTEMSIQRERSQTASKGVFRGGLADHSEETKKLHTATHLMYEALRRVLGDHVIQRGSNVTAERTRFDFSHDQKVTREQLDQVEKIVNEQIEKDLVVEWHEYPTEEAFKIGAKGAFGDKYGEKVKVYTMGKDGEQPYSIEICGGPHVEHTGQLAEGGKKFKVTKEEASSSGVRRIKAVLA